MFDVKTYLSRLGHQGPAEPTLETLRAIHKKHLLSIAFDNSRNADRGFEVFGDIRIDEDAVFEEIVIGGRGGVCYELNGLLRRLLTDLGFDVRILGAQLNGGLGPELEHVFSCVHLDGETWLVDVGLAGPSFLEPLRITDHVQSQYGVDYRLVPDGEYQILQRRSQNADWSPIYRFILQDRDLSEWLALIPTLETFPAELAMVGTRMHSRALDNGQMVLIGRRYVKVEDGKDEICVLVKDDQYRSVVDRILTNAA